MRRKGWMLIVAVIGIASAVWAIKRGKEPPPKATPVNLPPEKPYPKGIAAAGIIEAAGENIAIGSSDSGIVQEIYVEVKQRVKKGDPLFKLDSRELESELKVAEAKKHVAQADYRRLQDQLVRLQSIQDCRAISQEETRSKENEVAVAFATLTQLKREKEKMGVLLDRLTVRSPIQGMVLQKNIKVGEYLLAASHDRPPLIVGDVSRLQIRTDVDEQNASRIVDQAAGVAYPKNRPDYAIPLTFVRIEPYVVPKTSLTGSSKEKVDTRVLQVIYHLTPPEDIALYIGQQVDVYIEREPAKIP